MFSYPLRLCISALKNFLSDIPAGKMIVLIGPSSSWRSTVVDVLEKRYGSDEGSIQLGGAKFTPSSSLETSSLKNSVQSSSRR
jgi:ABC-type branched-subunit amino acid transport system ATPase component